MQPDSHSHAEAVTNVVVGAFVSWVLTLIIFGVSAKFAAAVTLVFAVASYVRSYLIRRMFNWLNSNPLASMATPVTATFKSLMDKIRSGLIWIKDQFVSLCSTLSRFF